MAKRKDIGNSKAERLKGAVSGMSWEIIRSVNTPKHIHIAQRDGIARSAIKFPNSASALRQHVARVQKEPTAKAKVQLRLPARTEAPLVTLSAPSPSPATSSISASTIATPAELGRIVRAARDRQRLSQSALATLAGTGRRFIVELEAGKPTAAFGLALAVCKALRIELVATSQHNE